MRKNSAVGALLVLMSAGVAAADCRSLDHDGRGFTVCTAVLGQDDLRLFLSAPDGRPFASFERVNTALAPAKLGFAMNAGMYHPDRSPVGLYLENGVQAGKLVTSDGPGNFGLLPNGVFCIAPDGFRVIETRAYAKNPPDCSYASQSGPLLVIGGNLHPRFLPTSDSRYVRNGVGVSTDGQTAYFAISDDRVNFTEFARMFRDALKVPDALYFDGSISRLYAPEIGRNDPGFAFGPVVGTVLPQR